MPSTRSMSRRAAERVKCPTLVLHARADRDSATGGRAAACRADPGRAVRARLTRDNHIMLEGRAGVAALFRRSQALLARAAARRGSASVVLSRAHAARSRGTRAHRAGTGQRADRGAPRALREDGAQQHHPHLRQTSGREPLAGDRRRPRGGVRREPPFLPGIGRTGTVVPVPTPPRKNPGTGDSCARVRSPIVCVLSRSKLARSQIAKRNASELRGRPWLEAYCVRIGSRNAAECANQPSIQGDNHETQSDSGGAFRSGVGANWSRVRGRFSEWPLLHKWHALKWRRQSMASRRTAWPLNGIDLHAKRPNERSLDRMPPSANGSKNVAARPRSECFVEPERCAIDAPRSQAPESSVQSITLPDGSIIHGSVGMASFHWLRAESAALALLAEALGVLADASDQGARLTVVGTEFRLRLPDARVLSSADLVGAIVDVVEVGGRATYPDRRGRG